MNAGRNTPRSVLAYIDTVWRLNAPIDPVVLARELGYSPKGIRKLRERHGEDLGRHLERVRRAHADTPRFLARQQGRFPTRGLQYASSPQGAIDEAEAVDAFTLSRLTRDAHRRRQADELDSHGRLLAAMSELRAAIAELPPERRRKMSRTLWTLRSRLDSAERDIRRRVAA